MDGWLVGWMDGWMDRRGVSKLETKVRNRRSDTTCTRQNNFGKVKRKRPAIASLGTWGKGRNGRHRNNMCFLQRQPTDWSRQYRKAKEARSYLCKTRRTMCT